MPLGKIINNPEIAKYIIKIKLCHKDSCCIIVLFCSSLLNRYTFQYSIRTHTWSRALFVFCSVSTCPLMLDICSLSCSLSFINASFNSFLFLSTTCYNSSFFFSRSERTCFLPLTALISSAVSESVIPAILFIFLQGLQTQSTSRYNKCLSVNSIHDVNSIKIQCNFSNHFSLWGGGSNCSNFRTSMQPKLNFTFWGGSDCSNFRTSMQPKLNFTFHFGWGGPTTVTAWYNSNLFISIVSKPIYIFNTICAYLLAINTVILVDLLGAK